MADEKKKQGSEAYGGQGEAGAPKGTAVTSEVPERREGQLNPSAPGETGTTPSSSSTAGAEGSGR